MSQMKKRQQIWTQFLHKFLKFLKFLHPRFAKGQTTNLKLYF